MNHKFTILLIFCGLFFSEPLLQAKVIHPPRVYQTGVQKKKHWWQRNTPKSRAKRRAKVRNKRRKVHASKPAYDPMWNAPLANTK